MQEKYSWIEKINKALLKLDEIPLLRNYAPFNFKKFAENLQQKFSLNNIEIKASELKWLSKEEIKKGFSSNLNYLSLSFSPLEGNVFALIDLEDISKLTNELLNQTDQISFTTTMLQESYFRYIALEVLDILNKMNLFQDLSPKITENIETKIDDSLTFDVTVKISSSTCILRIIIEPKFRKAWESYFINNPPAKEDELSQTLNLVLNAEIGSVNLTYQALKKIKKGDFVILDKIDYDPKNQKGNLLLKLGDTPLFLAKLKENKIKIIDFANYFKEEYMPEENNKEKKPNIEEENQLPTAALETIPINISVEAARIKLTLEKLMDLQPGNLLDLNVSPQRGVDLIVNGQKIAKGELINLGETLGVRILEIG